MSDKLITLYHFTNRPNVELILKSKTISAGTYLSKKTLKQGLISLTTDPDHKGHGLTDGREILESQVLSLRYATELNGKYYCVDNTEFCIKFSLPANSVVPASAIHDENELSILEKTAHLPCEKQASQDQVEKVALLMAKGTLNGKANTWWYHKGDLSLKQFDLLHKQPPGTYCSLPKNSNGEHDLSSIPVATIFEYS